MKSPLTQLIAAPLLLLLVAGTSAAGANDAEAERSEKTSDEPTAEEVSSAPRPHQDVSGIEGGQEGVPKALWVPRVILFPVRGALEVAMAPLRGLIYVEQKYAIRDRLADLFFTDDGNFGVYPTALVETGFGLNVGARMVWKKMFDTDARLRLRVGYGGQSRKLFQADQKIPLTDRIVVSTRFLAEDRPRDRFLGIGNADETSTDDLPPTLIDAINDETAVHTRFAETLVQAGLRLDIALPGPFSMALESSYVRRRFQKQETSPFATGSTRLSVEQVYDTSTIPGFDDGVDYIYNELELTLDTRRTSSRFESDPIPGTGWYFELYGGVAESVKDDSTSFYRYGADAQRYFRLGQNPRTLVLRAHLEGVTGTLDEVPFTELPRLGGVYLLRGYRRDRFRDRVRTLVTAEYQWDLSGLIAGFVYTDVGQVFRNYDDMDLTTPQIAFGGGLQMQTSTSYIGRILLGASVDGDLLINFAFDPAFDIQSRTERK